MSDDVIDGLSVVLVHLMKGIVERDSSPQLWQTLSERQSRVRDYVSVIGLDLEIDEAEGFALLRQKNLPAKASRSCRGSSPADRSAIPSACYWHFCASGSPSTTRQAASPG